MSPAFTVVSAEAVISPWPVISATVMALAPVKRKLEPVLRSMAPAVPALLSESKVSSELSTLRAASSEVAPTVAKAPPLIPALLKTVSLLTVMVLLLAADCRAP